MNDQQQGGFGLGALVVAAAIGFFLGRGCERIELPKPQPPVVTPKPIASGPLWFVVIEDTAERTQKTARVLNDVPFWDGIEAEGHRTRFYDDDAPEVAANGYLKALGAVTEPALLVLDAHGKPLRAVPLPPTTAEIETIKKELTGR